MSNIHSCPHALCVDGKIIVPCCDGDYYKLKQKIYGCSTGTSWDSCCDYSNHCGISRTTEGTGCSSRNYPDLSNSYSEGTSNNTSKS